MVTVSDTKSRVKQDNVQSTSVSHSFTRMTLLTLLSSTSQPHNVMYFLLVPLLQPSRLFSAGILTIYARLLGYG